MQCAALLGERGDRGLLTPACEGSLTSSRVAFGGSGLPPAGTCAQRPVGLKCLFHEVTPSRKGRISLRVHVPAPNSDSLTPDALHKPKPGDSDRRELLRVIVSQGHDTATVNVQLTQYSCYVQVDPNF